MLCTQLCLRVQSTEIYICASQERNYLRYSLSTSSMKLCDIITRQNGATVSLFLAVRDQCKAATTYESSFISGSHICLSSSLPCVAVPSNGRSPPQGTVVIDGGSNKRIHNRSFHQKEGEKQTVRVSDRLTALACDGALVA